MVGVLGPEAEAAMGIDGASTWSGFEVMCNALECTDWRIADISIGVEDCEAEGEGSSPILQYKISFEQPQPLPQPQAQQQPAAAVPRGRKGGEPHAYPRCTLLVEESLRDGGGEAHEPGLTRSTPGSGPGTPGGGSGTPVDIHASLREAIRRASSAPNGTSGADRRLDHGHQHSHAHQGLRESGKAGSPQSLDSIRVHSRGLGNSSSCSSSSEAGSSAVASGAGSFAYPSPGKVKGALPVASEMPQCGAHNARLESAVLADAIHGLFGGIHSPPKADKGQGTPLFRDSPVQTLPSSVTPLFRDSPGAPGKPPKWAKGKEPLAEKLMARCRSAASSKEFALSDRDVLDFNSPGLSPSKLRTEGGSSSSRGPGSGDLASVADEEDGGAPRLVLSSRRTASTPPAVVAVVAEGRDVEVRSRKGRRGPQDKSQWGDLYGA